MKLLARTAALAASVSTICTAAVAFSPDAARAWQMASGPKEMTGKPAASGASALHATAYFPRYRDGRSTGPAFDAYYGVVQVQAVIRGGRVVAVNVLRYPSHSSTSRSINSRALPRLEQEVIRAQSAYVHAISGATLTSDAFIRSMNDALRQASG